LAITAGGDGGNGLAGREGGTGGPGGDGAGIFNAGTLDLNTCTISENVCGKGGVGGEGYFNGNGGNGGEGGNGGGRPEVRRALYMAALSASTSVAVIVPIFIVQY
jgi:hypothetical protein